MWVGAPAWRVGVYGSGKVGRVVLHAQRGCKHADALLPADPHFVGRQPVNPQPSHLEPRRSRVHPCPFSHMACGQIPLPLVATCASSHLTPHLPRSPRPGPTQAPSLPPLPQHAWRRPAACQGARPPPLPSAITLSPARFIALNPSPSSHRRYFTHHPRHPPAVQHRSSPRTPSPPCPPSRRLLPRPAPTPPLPHPTPRLVPRCWPTSGCV